MIAHVKLRLFSGWPNPEWTIGDTESRKLVRDITNLQQIVSEMPRPKPRLGYRGLTITLVTGEKAPVTIDIYNQWVVDNRFEVARLDAKRQLENMIFKTAPKEVARLFKQMSFSAITAMGTEVQIAGLNPPDSAKIGCANGPSAPGSKDWILHAGYNNCYNYANDVLNIDEWSSSALPGTLTKMPATTVTAQVKAKLRTAITADGLTRVASNTVPAGCPAANKHYMVVILRHHPSAAAVKDFHCFRLDTDGTWSHKDASGIPRNTDDAGANPNTGDIITDLTQAKFDGNPVLVGVYRAKKNNTKVK